MHIYIMRHGQAEMMGHSDAERALTALGRLENEMMASYLAEQDITFDAVLVSPYLRAQQTWQSVFPYFSGVDNIQTLPFLTPGGSARESVNEILALQAAGVERLLIVSHLPLVGYIVGELAPEAGVPAFSTSAVGIVELDDSGFGTLHSLTSVAQLSEQVKSI
ncbi:phosphohistidine phosphatase SixA [Psychromonas sp.]|uniref:phosphohistidine phosphatase SixA n=1 Tax=Psychromonas sp. TaxID=1884585 RepID=UPI00356A9829